MRGLLSEKNLTYVFPHDVQGRNSSSRLGDPYFRRKLFSVIMVVYLKIIKNKDQFITGTN